MTERTLVLIKPDGVTRGLVGEILRRAEAKGFTLVALQMREGADDVLREHYAEHVGRTFFAGLMDYMTQGPLVAAVLEGQRVVQGWRLMMGTTDPATAVPGTIRGDLGRDWGTEDMQNLVHGSDSPESAEREIALWFPELV